MKLKLHILIVFGAGLLTLQAHRHTPADIISGGGAELDPHPWARSTLLDPTLTKHRATCS